MPRGKKKKLHGKFQYEFFDCFDDCGTCYIAYICPCIIYGQTQQLAYDKPGCFGDCCAYGCLHVVGCSCFLGMSGRQLIRNMRGIEGDCCTDFLAHWCCRPLALTQEKREIDVMRCTPVVIQQPVAMAPMQVNYPQPGVVYHSQPQPLVVAPSPQPIYHQGPSEPPPMYVEIETTSPKKH